MGKKKVALIGQEPVEKKQKKAIKPVKSKEVKPVESEKVDKKLVKKEASAKKAKKPSKKTAAKTNKEDTETEKEKKSTTERKPKVRGKKYLASKKKVKTGQLYPLEKAIKLVKETSLGSFVGTLEAHLNVKEKGDLGELSLPYSKEKKKKVAIADEKTVAQIKAGKIDFEVLLASPKMMGSLVPFARVLGPKGLMPNPKNGTLIDNPEKAVAKFSKGGARIRTEKKAPVVHLKLGKLDQPDKELVANVKELIKTITTAKIEKIVLKATMGPAVRVKV